MKSVEERQERERGRGGEEEWRERKKVEESVFTK